MDTYDNSNDYNMQSIIDWALYALEGPCDQFWVQEKLIYHI